MNQTVKNLYLKGSFNHNNFGDDLLLFAVLYFFENNLNYTNEDLNIFIDKQANSIEKLKFDSKLKVNNYCDPGYIINDKLRETNMPRAFKLLILVFMLFANILSAVFYKFTRLNLFNKSVNKFYKDLDVIYYIGGGYLTDTWYNSVPQLAYDYINLIIAKLINPKLKVIGTGMGLGPIRTKPYEFIFKNFMKNFDCVFVRENQSAELLAELNINVPVKNLGDDALLLYPYFKNLETDNEKAFSFNFKDFHYHDYADYIDNLTEVVGYFKDNGYKLNFFAFGELPGPDDSRLVKLFNKNIQDSISVYNPYKIGFDKFIAKLLSSQVGMGFAYHFNVILSLSSLPVLGVYSSNYSKQKINNVVKDMNDNSIILKVDELKSSSLANNLAELLSLAEKEKKESAIVNQKYQEMTDEYKKMFEGILN